MRSLISLPVIGDIRTWYLNQKKERERQRKLRIRYGLVRHKPHTEAEIQREMESYLRQGYYTDSEGKQCKREKLGRSVESYYKE